MGLGTLFQSEVRNSVSAGRLGAGGYGSELHSSVQGLKGGAQTSPAVRERAALFFVHT